MRRGGATRSRRWPWVVAAATAAAVVLFAWGGGDGPAAPWERTAALVTADATFLLQVPTLSAGLELLAAAREETPALDRGLSAARDLLGHELLDPDTWRGLGLDLDGSVSVALVPAPPLAGVLVVSLPIHRGTPVIEAAPLLFARVPAEERPRMEQTGELGTTLGRVRTGGRLRGILVEWEDRILVALPWVPGTWRPGSTAGSTAQEIWTACASSPVPACGTPCGPVGIRPC